MRVFSSPIPIIGIFLALAATILVCIFIVPEKKRPKLPHEFCAMCGHK